MVAALLVAITLSVSSDASGAPNIVFVMLDDVGFADVGDYAKHALPNHGGDISSIPTPMFDELARDGVRLTQYYSQPTCTPTRASFLTGRYAINHGLSFPITPGSPVGLPRHMATLPQELRKLGYSADMVGKVSCLAALFIMPACYVCLIIACTRLLRSHKPYSWLSSLFAIDHAVAHGSCSAVDDSCGQRLRNFCRLLYVGH